MTSQKIKLSITEARFLMVELSKEKYIPDSGDVDELILMEIFAEQFQKVQRHILEKKETVNIILKPSQLYVLSSYFLYHKFNNEKLLPLIRPIVALFAKGMEKQETLFTNLLQNAIE